MPTEERILLDHGAGGRASQELLERVFLPALGAPGAGPLEDAAVLAVPAGRVAFTTDTFTVTPLFFPGGDIGDLAVNGTVNDLCMRGARPLALSTGFVIEEGLPVATLTRVVASMARAAAAAGVPIVTGDTKVVPRGAADGLFINTSGIGHVADDVNVTVTGGRPGDRVLISGTFGDHGVAVLAAREGLTLHPPVESDTAALNHLVAVMLEAGGKAVHVLRDPTRGGVGTTLNEIARSSGVGIDLCEDRLPVTSAVRGALDILGLDPLYVANEGKVMALVAPEAADAVLAAIKAHPLGRLGADIGEATAESPGRVTLNTIVGGRRLIGMLTGAQLPRIC